MTGHLPLQTTPGLGLDGLGLLFGTAVFLVYTAILVYFGYDGWKHSTSLRDFVLGSRKLNGFIVGISFGATYASANMFMGVPGMAYEHGTPALWWSTIGFGLPFIAAALFAKRFWLMSQLGVGDMTLPEWIAKRYDSPFLRAGAGVLSLFLIFYIVGQAVGAATLFETIFGLNYITGLFLALVLVTFYVAIGGMHTTIMTDFFQGVIMLGIAVLTFGSLWTVFDGGMATVVTQLDAIGKATWFNNGTSNFIFDSAFGVLVMSWFLLAFILMPHLMNRILVLEDEQELRKFIFGAGLSLFGMSVFMIWAGLAARALWPTAGLGDAAVPMYLMEAFPAWLAIIMVVGILSAILTTADSLLHAMTSIVQTDLYKETYVKHCTSRDHTSPETDTRASRVGQLASVGIAIVAFYFGLERPDSLFMLTQIGIAGFLSGTAMPVILGYFWKHSTKRGAEVGFVAGMVTYIVLFFGLFGVTFSVENQFLAFTVASIASTVGMVIVSPFTTRSVENQQAVAFGNHGEERLSYDD